MADANSRKPISEIASHLGLDAADLISYGHTKAKVKLDVLKKHPPREKLVIISDFELQLSMRGY